MLGTGGNLSSQSPRGVVDFRITSLKSRGRRFPIQAIVLCKVISDLRSSLTPFNNKWKHLLGLELADPDFGTLGAIDLLLGTKVFGQVVLHGQRFGPQGSLTELKVMGYRGGVVFLSTSTTSSYCTIALSMLKTTQYEANDTGKHWKTREVHNSQGCELTEAANM